MKNTLVILLLLLASCGGKQPTDINCKYPGGVIMDKSNWFPNEPHESVVFDIKYKGKIKRHVIAYKIDFAYKVGDTINKNCIK